MQVVVLEERGGEGFPFLEGEDDCFGGRGGIFFFFLGGRRVLVLVGYAILTFCQGYLGPSSSVSNPSQECDGQYESGQQRFKCRESVLLT